MSRPGKGRERCSLLASPGQGSTSARWYARAEAVFRRIPQGSLRGRYTTGVFTPIVLQMIAVGEETGEMDELLGEVADMYEREVDHEIKNLSTNIEPIITIALGILVLILALGVFLPIWEMGKVMLMKK